MTPADILDVARDGILTVILVSAPLMVVGLVVGVIVSLIQALTRSRSRRWSSCRRSSPSSPP